MIKERIRTKLINFLGIPKDTVDVKEFNKVKKLTDTHQDYLNNIYAFHNLQPNKYLSLMHEVCYELMFFFDKVCEKHGIQYWMDYGTLLGAYRHEDIIPWDDDLDVSMTRSDYIKFIDIIQDEIDATGLNEYIKADLKIDKHDNKSVRWLQVSFYYKEYAGKFIGIDIYPHDFLKDYDGRDIEDEYMLFSKEYYHNPDDHDLEESVYEFYDKFNCTLEKDTHLIPGLECTRNNLRTYSVYKFDIIETDKIFPLIKLPFGKYEFSAPIDPRSYLISIYGKKFLQIPKKIRDHNRLNKFRKRENIMEILEECADLLKKANEKYR